MVTKQTTLQAFRKSLLVTLALITLLAACAPAQPSQGQVQSLVQTSVASTMQAQNQVGTFVAQTVQAYQPAATETQQPVATETSHRRDHGDSAPHFDPHHLRDPCHGVFIRRRLSLCLCSTTAIFLRPRY